MVLSVEELARQTAQDLFDGTAVIFLGAGASVGDDSERAVGKGVQLAAARNSLVQAEAAANALHSPTRARSIRAWFADVLLDAGFARYALVRYAEVGDREKVEQVADGLRGEVPPGDEDAQLPVGHLLELAKAGPLHSRGPVVFVMGARQSGAETRSET